MEISKVIVAKINEVISYVNSKKKNKVAISDTPSIEVKRTPFGRSPLLSA